MAIFDRLGDVISNTGRDIAESAKTATEISNLNGQIRMQQAQIQKMFTEIGQAYYLENKEKSDSVYNGQIADINEAYIKIDELQKNINNIKGLQICPKCGASIPKDAVFCAACGTNIAALRAAKSQSGTEENIQKDKPQRLCPNCGKPVEEDARFCMNCGSKIG